MKLYKNIFILKRDNLLNLAYYNNYSILKFNTLRGSVSMDLFNFRYLRNDSLTTLKLFSSNRSDVKQLTNFFFSFINGISKGFFYELSLRGIGFKCYYFDENKLFLSLGYSHFIIYNVPLDVVVFLKKGRIFLYAVSKELLGNVVSDLKNLRIPDAYKAKGIVESNKIFSLKEGKKR
jgi:ribosomal protein L6P/L9E